MTMTNIEDLSGIDESSAKKLEKAGFGLEKIAVTSPAELVQILSVKESIAVEIIEEAREATFDNTGFETASNVSLSADFTELDIPDEVDGWGLFLHNSSHIGWETPAGYRLFIEGHRSRIWGSLPNENHDAASRITEDQVLRPRMSSAKEAIRWAENWMGMRAVDSDLGLDKYTGISKKTSEHLQIVYGVKSSKELYNFYREDEAQLQDVVGNRFFDELKSELKETFGTSRLV